MEAVIAKNEEQMKDAFYVREEVFVKEQNVPAEEEIDELENESEHIVVYDSEKPVGAGRWRMKDGYGKLERICVLKKPPLRRCRRHHYEGARKSRFRRRRFRFHFKRANTGCAVLQETRISRAF